MVYELRNKCIMLFFPFCADTDVSQITFANHGEQNAGLFLKTDTSSNNRIIKKKSVSLIKKRNMYVSLYDLHF